MRNETLSDTESSDSNEPRTSQARRSAQTRARIVAAAVSCVDEHGFPGTTFQRVARGAGVTVGAVQHYFSSKTEVLSAVLEDSFQHLTSCFDDISLEELAQLPLRERISIFVDRVWRHCSSPTYRSTIQILLSSRSDVSQSRDHWSDSSMTESTAQALEWWRSIFADLEIREEKHVEMLRFVFSSLGGIAIMERLAPVPDGLEVQLVHVKDLVSANFDSTRSTSKDV